ncbi:MAG: DNA polymerase III subunit chi [Pseudomonadota bacterium]
MTDIHFYHLTTGKLEAALPQLVERCRGRDWNVVIQTGSETTCQMLDELLWTYRDDSFLPHGRDGKGPGEGADNPICLTTGEDRPNDAAVRFLVDGATITQPQDYERVITIFDGYDDSAVAQARGEWKRLKSEGHALTYWQQDEEGRWGKKG